MKHLANSTLVVILSLFTVVTFAQQKLSAKPALFKSFPNTILCKEAELNEPFTAVKGKNVTLKFSGTSYFSGEVINNVTKSKSLQYLSVRLANLDNAVLALTKRVDEKNNVFYVGHIINPKNSDAFELRKMKDGSYQFVKIDLDKLLPACSPE
ncbi:hypothetical protein [Ferruginibacter albus]|uniref:hypothetical protein n=1 Tax=Ferruginibacter albus TaxID=2875540 RepID=UPI001CC40335|nr:hypothetical protein [Ferruginibacter albus]UAY52493.1 hypothetical protein K9M53_02095 [Ferruginibacter albus]